MKSIAAIIAAVALAGCQTVITAEKYPEQVIALEGGKYVIASGGWSASARSPLWATESLRGLDLGVGTNSTVYLRLDTYNRDLSTNAVVLTEKAVKGLEVLTALAGLETNSKL